MALLPFCRTVGTLPIQNVSTKSCRTDRRSSRESERAVRIRSTSPGSGAACSDAGSRPPGFPSSSSPTSLGSLIARRCSSALDGPSNSSQFVSSRCWHLPLNTVAVDYRRSLPPSLAVPTAAAFCSCSMPLSSAADYCRRPRPPAGPGEPAYKYDDDEKGSGAETETGTEEGMIHFAG